MCKRPIVFILCFASAIAFLSTAIGQSPKVKATSSPNARTSSEVEADTDKLQVQLNVLLRISEDRQQQVDSLIKTVEHQQARISSLLKQDTANKETIRQLRADLKRLQMELHEITTVKDDNSLRLYRQQHDDNQRHYFQLVVERVRQLIDLPDDACFPRDDFRLSWEGGNLMSYSYFVYSDSSGAQHRVDWAWNWGRVGQGASPKGCDYSTWKEGHLVINAVEVYAPTKKRRTNPDAARLSSRLHSLSVARTGADRGSRRLTDDEYRSVQEKLRRIINPHYS